MRGLIELTVCRTVGCTSPFAYLFGWPLRACAKVFDLLYDDD